MTRIVNFYPKIPPPASALVVFLIADYIAWLILFGILRYAGELEVLTGILIVLFLGTVGKGHWKITLNLLATLFLLFYTIPPDWGHSPFYNQLFRPQFLRKNFPSSQKVFHFIEDDSLVFSMRTGTSYILPLLSTKAKFMGGYHHNPKDYPVAEQENIKNKFDSFFTKNLHVEALQKRAIQTHQGPIYILSEQWPLVIYKPILAKFNLTGNIKDCIPFAIPPETKHYVLCKVSRMNTKT